MIIFCYYILSLINNLKILIITSVFHNFVHYDECDFEHVPESVVSTGLQPRGPPNLQLGLDQPRPKLVIFEPPTPVTSTHSVDFSKMVSTNQQNASSKRGVVVFRMVLGRRNVKWTLLRKCVGKIRIQREQIHVVKSKISTTCRCFFETDVEQKRTVKPKVVNLIDDDETMLHTLVS